MTVPEVFNNKMQLSRKNLEGKKRILLIVTDFSFCFKFPSFGNSSGKLCVRTHVVGRRGYFLTLKDIFYPTLRNTHVHTCVRAYKHKIWLDIGVVTSCTTASWCDCWEAFVAIEGLFRVLNFCCEYMSNNCFSWLGLSGAILFCPRKKWVAFKGNTTIATAATLPSFLFSFF